jgi:hypothetical protein
MNTVSDLALRVGVSVTLGISGLIHAYLYIHGYREIPVIGPAFLVQAGIFCALAVLILAGGPAWLRLTGGALSLATLVAFALSRTIGLAGFTEHGWESPYGPVTVIAQVLTLVLAAVSVLTSRSKATSTQPQTRSQALGRRRRDCGSAGRPVVSLSPGAGAHRGDRSA